MTFSLLLTRLRRQTGVGKEVTNGTAESNFPIVTLLNGRTEPRYGEIDDGSEDDNECGQCLAAEHDLSFWSPQTKWQTPRPCFFCHVCEMHRNTMAIYTFLFQPNNTTQYNTVSHTGDHLITGLRIRLGRFLICLGGV